MAHKTKKKKVKIGSKISDSRHTTNIDFGPNGAINYTPLFILPKGVKAACHLHDKPMYFKTIKDCQKHMLVLHDYRKQ